MKTLKILSVATVTVIALTSISCSGSADKSAADSDSIATVLPNKIAEVKVMELQPSVFSHEIVSNGKNVGS